MYRCGLWRLTRRCGDVVIDRIFICQGDVPAQLRDEVSRRRAEVQSSDSYCVGVGGWCDYLTLEHQARLWLRQVYYQAGCAFTPLEDQGLMTVEISPPASAN